MYILYNKNGGQRRIQMVMMRCDMMHVREGEIPVQMRGRGSSRLGNYESHGEGAREYHQDRCVSVVMNREMNERRATG